MGRCGRSASLVVTGFGVLGAACAGENHPAREGDVPASAPLCSTADGSLGAAPLRRLTRFEYGRTLSELTGADPSVADALPPDEKSLGFDDMAGAYSVSALHASKYLEVAEQVAGALLL